MAHKGFTVQPCNWEPQSQCKDARTGVMVSVFLELVKSVAAHPQPPAVDELEARVESITVVQAGGLLSQRQVQAYKYLVVQG